MKFFTLLWLCVISLAVSQSSESAWEDMFLQLPDASYAYEHLAYYTSLPHVAGTIEDYQTAVYTQAMFANYGLNAEIEEERVLLSYPNYRLVELLDQSNQTLFTCSLQEDYEPTDPTSGDPRVIPTFNGYSPSGDVTAEVVYVNYASVQDFQLLKKANVDLKGKIGIARYGSVFRGTKAMIAQEHGMIGLLIYSDPADDGYAQGPVYPEGPYRSNSSVQRGSVLFLSVCPGNPTRDVCVLESQRSSYSYTQVIPSIPVQPLSYADALPILSAIGGTEAPESFVGALPITYHLGPGPAIVHMKLDMEFVNTTIWNVIASIDADISSPVKSEQVLIGNHRDAWVFGAADPNSGTSVMLEIARSYGVLLGKGWKPKRKIVFCSWDGEEYGLLGSTAYAERHADVLTNSAVAYLNVDTGVTGGSFSASATPSLAPLIRNVSFSVPYPGSGGNLSDHWSGAVGVLGSGSDYTAFLDHFGIPCLAMQMNGPYGVYHSVYDSAHWMSTFGDPTYNYYVTLSQQLGLVGMRLIDSEIVQLNFTEYGQQLSEYLVIVTKRAEKANINLHFTPLSNAINSFNSAAAQVATQIANSHGFNKELNTRLLYTERQFLGLGLPKRPYYRHVIQAPGLYQGYAPEIFPGITQAIEESNQEIAQIEIQITADTIEKAASFLLRGDF